MFKNVYNYKYKNAIQIQIKLQNLKATKCVSRVYIFYSNFVFYLIKKTRYDLWQLVLFSYFICTYNIFKLIKEHAMKSYYNVVKLYHLYRALF